LGVADEVELYEALIARPGVYLADGGPINITPERTARWEREFNRFRAAGYEIPTPWGHKLKAVPHDPADPYRLDEEISRWNAGYVESLRRDARTGELFMLAQVPPGYRYDKARRACVNDRDQTVIREVSPGFGDMIDGQGRHHHDVLFHVALCTHPVLPGQPGFGPGGTAARRPSVRFMSAAGRITRLQFLASPGGKAMADADDDKKGKKKDAGGPTGDPPIEPDGSAGPGSDAPKVTDVAPTDAPPDVAPAAPEAPEPALDPTLAAPEPADPAGLGQVGFTPTQVEQVKQIFAQLGSPLLPDTSPQNVVERIIVVLHTAANAGASLMPQAAAGGAGGQPLDLSTENAVPDQNATGGGMGGLGTATFMHHSTRAVLTLDPDTRASAEAGAKSEADALAAEWDKLASGAPAALKAVVARERAAAGSHRFLSLNPQTGQVIAKAARDRLFFAKELLAAGGVYRIKAALSRATPATNPTADAPAAAPTPPAGKGATDDELRTEIARTSGIPVEAIVIRRGHPVRAAV
jgi:hypothetical protein